MSHKIFGPNDVFINRVKAHPEWDFFIYNSEVYINNSPNISGSLDDTFKGVPPGFLSLYEYNINRSGSYIHPFVVKNSNYRVRFRSDLNNMVGETNDGAVPWGALGTEISSSYRMSASITRKVLNVTPITVQGPYGTYTIPNHNNTSSVLRNTCLQYQTINPSFSSTVLSGNVSSSLDGVFRNKINMINIPSIFYGSEIKKGTMELNYYITGTLVATARDSKQNGQLVCTHGTSSVLNTVVGHVLYREGILFFPKPRVGGELSSTSNIVYNGSPDFARWTHFGHGANEKDDSNNPVTTHPSHVSASYSINFQGTTHKNVLTMFCHAEKGQLNYSNNPTFLNTEHSSSIVGFTTGSFNYSDNETEFENIASSSFHKGEDDFRKVTYLSKVGIYDEDNNLLMTVDLARPYKNEEKDYFTFKIKYDLL